MLSYIFLIFNIRLDMIRIARPLSAISRSALPRVGFAAARANSTSAAQQWIKDMTNRPATVSYDDFDTTRASQFKNTIPTDAKAPANYGVAKGDDLPKGMHLIYFQPTDHLDNLAKDGTSAVSQFGFAVPRTDWPQEYNAPEPYIRRMWAGGYVEWNPKSTIKIGDEVEQQVRVARAEEKAGMMFVYQAREVAPKGQEWAVKEERTHVFFPPKEEEGKGGAKPGGKKKSAGEWPWCREAMTGVHRSDSRSNFPQMICGVPSSDLSAMYLPISSRELTSVPPSTPPTCPSQRFRSVSENDATRFSPALDCPRSPHCS